MSLFISVNDAVLCERLRAARKQVVYAAPGITGRVAQALGELFKRSDRIRVAVVIDGSEDVCRIGYGDPEGLLTLSNLSREWHFPLQSQPGLRAGVLLTDDQVIVWSPAPQSVEAPSEVADAPNGVVLTGISGRISDAVGAPGSNTAPADAEIGSKALSLDDVKRTLEAIEQNPITPYDLARQTRVFASKFQFVETEMRGGEWIEREMRLSTLLLNVDLPEQVRDLLDTRVMPFVNLADVRVPAPVLVNGELAYSRDGKVLLKPASQADVKQTWSQLRSRYLVHLKHFGWLIRMTDKPAFEQELVDFEVGLKEWVKAFGEEIEKQRKPIVDQLTGAIMGRVRAAPRDMAPITESAVRRDVEASLSRLQDRGAVSIKRFYKAVAPESTRHQEFMEALERILPKNEFNSWCQEFSAVKERDRPAS